MGKEEIKVVSGRLMQVPDYQVSQWTSQYKKLAFRTFLHTRTISS